MEIQNSKVHNIKWIKQVVSYFCACIYVLKALQIENCCIYDRYNTSIIKYKGKMKI